MKKSSFLVFAVFTLFVITSSFAQNNSKVAGKVFPNADAAKLFGPVQVAVKVPVSELRSQLMRVNNSVMFMIKDNDLVISDSKRNLLRARNGITLKSTEVMHKFSKSVVNELLKKGQEDYVIFEQRGEVLTVTNGAFTMEFSTLCPPMCD